MLEQQAKFTGQTTASQTSQIFNCTMYISQGQAGRTKCGSKNSSGILGRSHQSTISTNETLTQLTSARISSGLMTSVPTSTNRQSRQTKTGRSDNFSGSFLNLTTDECPRSGALTPKTNPRTSSRSQGGYMQQTKASKSKQAIR